LSPQKNILDEIRVLAGDVFGLPPERITEASSPEGIEAWDSVQHLNLILALEQHFGIQFEPDELAGTSSIGAIASLVRTKQGLS
jgi:acyl carrier protein